MDTSGYMTNKRYISISTKPVDTKLGRIVAHDKNQKLQS